VEMLRSEKQFLLYVFPVLATFVYFSGIICFLLLIFRLRLFEKHSAGSPTTPFHIPLARDSVSMPKTEIYRNVFMESLY